MNPTPPRGARCPSSTGAFFCVFRLPLFLDCPIRIFRLMGMAVSLPPFAFDPRVLVARCGRSPLTFTNCNTGRSREAHGR